MNIDTHFNVIMSLGTRCYTELFLKHYNLIRFSSFFGSLNIKCIDNLLYTLKNDFTDIMTKTNLIKTYNYKFGERTLYKRFDNLNNFHSATFAHHIMDKEEHYKHFQRCIGRFHIIRDKRLRILFVFFIHQDEDRNHFGILGNKKTLELVNYLKSEGYNFHMLYIYLENINKEAYTKIFQNLDYSLYIIHNVDKHCTKNSRALKCFKKIIDEFKIDTNNLLKKFNL